MAPRGLIVRIMTGTHTSNCRVEETQNIDMMEEVAFKATASQLAQKR
jgi:hypothetical protein